MNALLLSLAALAPGQPAAAGVLPAGADGKPLNLDFEAGSLKDWTADGPAFGGQPVRGDAVARRRADMKSRHRGEFWVGGWERGGDDLQGTLTSAPFTVTHPWATFLVGGGAWPETCVELVAQPGGEVVFRASGQDEEDLRPVAVDLSGHRGKQLQIRLVDRRTGHWGHVNFDDFRFHSARPDLPPRPAKAPPARPDEFRHAGLSPEAAAAAMTVPEGFEVGLFAGEPAVHQPVALALDDRGRVWVAEAYTYPNRHPHKGPVLPPADRAKGDRIVILEDADGDGRHDKRTVFMEGLNLVSGLELGFGGVWVGAAPYLLFIPHDAATDKPAGEPKVLLDGWGYQDTHETLNTFTWGPDGWLYGCHGVFTHSKVGKPGTPDGDRQPINAGVWRYHPTRHEFEVFAHGTSNPWGLDYNAAGDFFISSCVIPHCYHIVQGGRYERQAGQHSNPHTYVDIKTAADHLHWAGANPWAGNNRSGDAGGGHAHCGLMIYQGGTWPKEYHGHLFMGNIHGRRLNVDIPKPKGSGYAVSHGKDFLLANDAWARFINLKYGPDGNVYLIDWYDKQACHRNEPEVWDRTNGRVYKICYKGAKPVAGVDLQKCTDDELVKYQLHDNEWYARHARRILQERATTFSRDAERSATALKGLEEIAIKHPDETRRLRGLWALAVTGLVDFPRLKGLAFDKSAAVRGWALKALIEGPDADRARFESAARDICGFRINPTTPAERRQIASAVLRAGPDRRAGTWWDVISSDPADADDPNLPALTWYVLEATAARDLGGMLDRAAGAKNPALLPLAARRAGAAGTPAAFAALTDRLDRADTDAARLALLRGLADGLKGRRGAAPPDGWADVYDRLAKSADRAVQSAALAVAVAFGDAKAADALRATLADRQAPLAARRAALATLLDAKDKNLPGVLYDLLPDPAFRPAVIRGLAAFDDPEAPRALLAIYATFTPAERRDALNTLAARPAYAKALLDAIAAKAVSAADVSADIIRQLRNLGDKTLDDQIAAVWGTVRDTPADRKRLIAAWQKKLTAPYQGPADLGLGRAVFARTCQQCHTLYGAGGKVGPDITGANRGDLGYLLENIFDPSAVIPKEYAATRLDLADGRVVTGIVGDGPNNTLTVVTPTETLVVPAADVDRRAPSPLSMMPEDVTGPLTEPEVKALFAYLRHPAQVPALATPDAAKDFFNGKDLSNWDGDKSLWAVENGEIVGKTATGLKRNTFLRSQVEVTDFRLSVKVKLTPNTENSGIQFRSEYLPDGEMRGPQADIGAGWWGKLYEESARGLLWKKPGDQHVKPGDWNEYVIEAVAGKVTTTINGQLCVDLDDPKLARRGLIAFQLHSGGPMEVRFKDVKLEVLAGK